MFHILTKADIVLFAALVAVAAGSLVYSGHAVAGNVSSVGGASERTVRVTVANEEYGEYPLDQDDEITITRPLSDDEESTNIIRIESGVVWMESSTCKNQVCVNDGRIDTVGQQIICLPNRVVVEIVGAESEKAFDAIAK